ncbi:sterol desaturase family protein [Erythrobacter sp. NE805]|uniref:sterol desaturase family protein n=1 Tax=Erythrobacter sp. NE805 TaxID=3389875 RepID=UPI00396B3955
MIETAFHSVTSDLEELAALGLLFGCVAYLTKREAMLAALRRARPEIVTNLALWLTNAAVVVPLLAVPILTGTSLIPRADALVAFWAGLPGWVAVIAAILLIDLAAYWRHRVEHVRLLWPVHAVHHADEAMNWLSVRRKHPLGEAFSMVCDNLVVIALGLPFWAIAGALVLRAWWGYFIHADVPWTLGPLGKVLISPAAHRLHHIRDETLMGANFGNTVVLWDWLFGTWLDPRPYANCDTGIAEGTRDFLGELARPFEARYWRKPEAPAVEQPAA